MAGAVVLVVEDDAAVRELVQEVVEEVVGSSTVPAASGEEALERTRERRPSLILLDFLLPRLGGPEVVRRLKADPATRSIPVVALTTLPREEALRAGVDDYVGKPFDVDLLAAKVRRNLEQSALQAA